MTLRAPRYAGDLRADLVRASLSLIAAEGPHGFSVAKVAKNLDVSSAAPYRHFADRGALLAAVAAESAALLRTQISRATHGVTDPAKALAAAAGSATLFLIEHRVDLALIFTIAPRGLENERRLLLADSLRRCRGVAPDPEHARRLLARLAAHVSGTAALYLSGLRTPGHGTAEAAARSAASTTHALIEAIPEEPR
ncbi:TetR/AcrR family transcriptional regulator [Amycolatopsis sp. NPDC098790]|uniref:TetR/AcrR family transcriptional regulator n=1 Tax=Amycolatopsis sp. NPDC098790 TaxID=3363939 RepID=UPI00380F8160